MRELINLVNRVSDSESAVLVTGERGVGKELVASALHESSRRRAAPFVTLRCGALPESQASPMPSASLSAWSALATAGQLSLLSGTPSPSPSGGAVTPSQASPVPS